MAAEGPASGPGTNIVWSDSGIGWTKDTDDKTITPLAQTWHEHHEDYRFLPVTYPKSETASVDNGQECISPHNLSAKYNAFLHQTAGENMAFYSLMELFRFAATTQLLFLNLVNGKLDFYTSLGTEKNKDVLQQLQELESVLYHHKRSMACVRERIGNFKKVTEGGHGKDSQGNVAGKKMLQDFDYLAGFSEELHSRTRNAIFILHSNISLTIAQATEAQGDRFEEIGFATFSFLPWGLTTGVFGMNLGVLIKEHVHWKWCVLVGVVLTAISFFIKVSFQVYSLQNLKHLGGIKVTVGSIKWWRGEEKIKMG
ncbi:hypothetical protein PT974_07460 [Cladobotryum mycophilum]|uniref:Magnesium transporter n=1 Tax=Cladobotryum mycophilum TaxID=491253 RepID=A0ABR0SQK9_9HYPO